MKKTNLLLGTAVAVVLSANAANAGSLYIADLRGANENPANTSPFTGRGYLILNDAETVATVTATHNVDATLTAGHIHRGTAAVNGPVIFPFPQPQSPMGPLTWNIPAADVVNLKALGLYMNFHTSVFPGGVIRDQLRRALFVTSATNEMQTLLAGALDGSYGISTDLDTVLMGQAFATGATKAAVLDELSGRTIYTQSRQELETMRDFQESLMTHGEQGGVASGTFGGFVKGGYGFGTRDNSSDRAGSDITRPYLLAGIEYGLADDVVVGLAVGYADGKDEFDGTIGRTDVQTTSVQGFITSKSDVLVASVVAGYGFSDIESNRALTTLGRTATSRHNGDAWSIGAKVAMPLPLGDGAIVAPYAEIDTQHAKVDAYSETIAGAAGLVVPKVSDHDTSAELGAMLSTALGPNEGLQARLQAGWRYSLSGGREMIATRLAGATATFNTALYDQAINTAHVAAALSGSIDENILVSVGYNGFASGRTTTHAVEARITLRIGM